MGKPILAAILSCSGLELTDTEKRIFSAANPLGISLFARNIESKHQIKKLVSDIKNVINRDDVIIAVDQEGGRVSRLQKISRESYVSAELLGQAEIKYSQMHAELISDEMRSLGLNVNFAPIVEIKQNVQTPALDGRCFSENTKRIINRAKVMADTYINMGICPCIKHIPGHFDMTTDPHLEGFVSEISKEEILRKTKYLSSFSGYPLAMTSHILLKSIDSKFPVSMSAICIRELLRKRLGYRGFLISDAIDMHALKGTIMQRAEQCWNAGIDAVCYCSGQEDDLKKIAEDKHFLTEKSLMRFSKIKQIFCNKAKTDTQKTREAYKKYFADKAETEYSYDATEVLNKMLKKERNNKNVS